MDLSSFLCPFQMKMTEKVVKGDDDDVGENQVKNLWKKSD